MKKFILISIIVSIGIISIVLKIIDKDIAPILGIGGIAFFLIFALWDPPPKHKNFTYKDQEKATFRALGGSGPIEIPEPPENEEKANINKY